MNGSDAAKMALQRDGELVWQCHNTVFSALALANDDCVVLKIQILYP